MWTFFSARVGMCPQFVRARVSWPRQPGPVKSVWGWLWRLVPTKRPCLRSGLHFGMPFVPNANLPPLPLVDGDAVRLGGLSFSDLCPSSPFALLRVNLFTLVISRFCLAVHPALYHKRCPSFLLCHLLCPKLYNLSGTHPFPRKKPVSTG